MQQLRALRGGTRMWWQRRGGGESFALPPLVLELQPMNTKQEKSQITIFQKSGYPGGCLFQRHLVVRIVIEPFFLLALAIDHHGYWSKNLFLDLFPCISSIYRALAHDCDVHTTFWCSDVYSSVLIGFSQEPGSLYSCFIFLNKIQTCKRKCEYRILIF